MRAVVILVVVCALGILSAGLWYVIGVSPASVSRTAGEVATSTIRTETDAYTISVEYPQFGIPVIDAQIQADIEGVVAEFKTLPQNPHDSATPRNALTGTFENTYVGDDVVSTKLILSQDTGGAHPLTLFSGINFDKRTGARLFLNDILPRIGKSTEEISRVATSNFKQTFGEGFFSEGATSNPENFSSFLVAKDAVTFIFQQYQVAAYAYGPQYLTFPRIK